MPNGSAAPLALTHSDTKKVQAKAMMERRMVTMTKQSPARNVYESMSCLIGGVSQICNCKETRKKRGSVKGGK